jgi:peptidyl-prolyl cis-trans isomerase C
MLRPFMVLIALFLAFSPWAGTAKGRCQDAKGTSATTVAAVDLIVVRVLGESITEKQVLDTINQLAFQLANNQQATGQQLQQKESLFYREALDTLIGTILLKNEAKERNLVADKAKIDESLRSMKARFPNEAQFQQALQGQGIKEEDLRSSIETNLLCQQVLELIAQDLPPPTDIEIQKYYDANPKSFLEPEQRHTAAISLKVDEGATPEQKMEIRKKLENIRADIGSKKITFAEAAVKESDDKANSTRGGDLGFVKRGAMLKPLEDMVFATKPGSLTPILETEIGYHLIQVIELKPAGIVPLETAQPKIKDLLERKAKQEATKKHLEQLKTKVKIETVMSDEEWNKRHPSK